MAKCGQTVRPCADCGNLKLIATMRLSISYADNEVKLLHCGTDYLPAWLEAIEAAQYDVYFETYIFAEDETGSACSRH